jgi:hypothetical protein
MRGDWYSTARPSGVRKLATTSTSPFATARIGTKNWRELLGSSVMSIAPLTLSWPLSGVRTSRTFVRYGRLFGR